MGGIVSEECSYTVNLKELLTPEELFCNKKSSEVMTVLECDELSMH